MKREEIVRQLADSIKTASVEIDHLITDDWVTRFKIGKSADPVEETRKRYEGEGYTGLHVVLESGSRPLIDVLEKVLIVMYMKRDPRRNQNEQIGGGGLKGSDAPYIYIAIEDAIMTALKKYSP